MMIHKNIYDNIVNMPFLDSTYRDYLSKSIDTLREEFPKGDEESIFAEYDIYDGLKKSIPNYYHQNIISMNRGVYQGKSIQMIIHDDNFKRLFVDYVSLALSMYRINMEFEASVYETQGVDFRQYTNVNKIFYDESIRLEELHGEDYE